MNHEEAIRQIEGVVDAYMLNASCVSRAIALLALLPDGCVTSINGWTQSSVEISMKGAAFEICSNDEASVHLTICDESDDLNDIRRFIPLVLGRGAT